MTSYKITFKCYLVIVTVVAFSFYCGFILSKDNRFQIAKYLPKFTQIRGILQKLDSLENYIKKQRFQVSGQFKDFSAKLSQFVLDRNTKPKEPMKTQEEPWRKSNKTGMILFTTWIDVAEKDIVHRNVFRTWRKWLPLIKPLFFYINASTGNRLKKEGWLVRPVPKTGCGDSNMPIMRDMFLDAVTNYKSVLYGYANGDITFDNGIQKAIDHLVESTVVQEKPVLILVRRTNVDFSNSPELDENSNITEMYNKGKAVMDGSSDGFFTNKLFPWEYVPNAVVGRIGIGMWLVSYARAMNVTVIDITKTVRAIHMTTKSGNLESNFKKNVRCNHVIYGQLNIVPSSWGCGHILCAVMEVIVDEHGKTVMIRKSPKNMEKKCSNCYMDLKKILP
ncbi:hypothetical protein LOTGIDRAFT_153537 [Lottia gigantea]|uniref:Uncharacterized protein n=1 Tax=Lottia gigantea TaxID=225164 RepID=V4BY66_LOTGI|nr:hypothetical protein LOTGIDRAFT_153537 [Lottia gigantea]ESO94054.1 hypothetical protein LOTGIDRAFT_153537 [Lottia gigantea]